MRHESSTSARRASELEQAEQEAEYVRLLEKEEVDRAEARCQRALAQFLRADERFLEAFAAANVGRASHLAMDLVGERWSERRRAVRAVERKRAELEQAAQSAGLLPLQGRGKR